MGIQIPTIKFLNDISNIIENIFATRMETLGIPRNRTRKIMDKEDSNMVLDI
jgi:hypothetical protein